LIEDISHFVKIRAWEQTDTSYVNMKPEFFL